MAGILVEYARFVNVQQRRARVVAQLVQQLQETPAETNGLVAVDNLPIEIGESRRQLRSTQDAAAPQNDDGTCRRGTTRGSVDDG
jgi:hypothetical protein